MEDKELIWVPKEVAEKFKSFENDVEAGEIVIQYIDRSKRDMETALEGLDEDVIIFKGWSARIKKAYKEALDEQLESSYAMFEEINGQIPSITKKVAEVRESLEPVKRDIQEINKALEGINTYRIEGLLETISLIKNALQDDNMKKILKMLVDNS